MARELKNADKIKAYFQTEAAKIIREIAGEPIHVFGNTHQFEVMTKYGRMRATTHDTFIACRFDSHNLARPVLVGPTTKWNHHAFQLGTVGRGREYADQVLHEFKSDFARIEPRRWETREVPITEDYLKEASMEALRDRQALGEIFIIEGFDPKQAAAEIADEVTDTDGGRPEWLIESVRNKLASETPLEVYESYRNWRKLNPKISETPNPGM